jgi:hypothetical protein
VVNADDFGYSPEISRGIIECAQHGIVTATGVFGNARGLGETVQMLADAPALESGVHLALTHGEPLTPAMQQALARFGGRFPGKFTMALLIARGRVGESMLRDELRAQVDACLEHGMRIAFLNAHEHLHMHPRVFPIVCAIARDLGVRFVRVTRPDVVAGGGLGCMVRDIIIRSLAPRAIDDIESRIEFLGLARSGRIDFRYLQAAFARLQPGHTYELMCHPGFFDPVLARDQRLRKYHDWDLERRSLQDPRLPELLAAHRITLVRFGELLASSAAQARDER